MTVDLQIDMPALVAFLTELLNTPSPTGYTAAAIDLAERAFRAVDFPNATFWRTNRGALVIEISGTNDDAPRGLTAHVDTLGAMVAEVKGNGRLRLTQVGGWIWNAVESENVTIHTANDGTYRGTIQTIKASTHAYGQASRDLPRDGTTMEVRLDARSTSKADTRALGIEVGDFVSFDPRVEVTETGFLKSRHLDDKASVACILAALRALKETEHSPAQRTTILISNNEETGHGATSGFPPDLVELLAVDMAVLGPEQNSDEFTAGICAKDSGGPYHHDMVRKLVRIAQQHRIAYKLDVYPFYGSDATAYVDSGGDVRTGLIGPGVEASHAYERTHLDGLNQVAHLIARYLLDNE
jgi:putative aminopeptidase FrvX